MIIVVTRLSCAFPADDRDDRSHRIVTDLLYRSDDDTLTDSMRKRCRLDIKSPVAGSGFPVVVWFHGGGLTGGTRSFPKELNRKDLVVATVEYRLHPDVKAPAYIEDAAAAVAWVFQHIEEYGGAADRIVVSGHSAGGYLTSMVGLDKRWLAAHDIDASRIAGIAPFSGQMITHFTIREEQGIEKTRPVIDAYAPLHHVRKDAPPILLITGDRELEMLGRYEENAYMWRMLKIVEHPDVTLHELDGFDHGGMAVPAFPLLLKFVDRVTQKSPK
ncbi:MAG: alpha/beta hydrolase fold domain-containing protein [Fuerstia sp.]|nr:alpha/beta hydrolase fold domain-containing protein [Fuerstiella sp.]